MGSPLVIPIRELQATVYYGSLDLRRRQHLGSWAGPAQLPARPLGTPMTYLVHGRQFVVLTLVGAQMVALALPSEP